MSRAADSVPIRKQPQLRLRELMCGDRREAQGFPFDAPRRRYFMFARNALAAATEALHLRPDDEVLLPAFHCVTLVEPFARAGVACRFYEIDRDLRADRSSLLQAISPKTRAIVVIHFFGLPEPLDDIDELCRNRRILLIEDCTHALYSSHQGRPLGKRGAMAVFSFRKTLPVFGGAMLVAGNDTIPLPTVSRPPPWSYSLRAVKAAVMPREETACSSESSDERDIAPRKFHTQEPAAGKSTMDDWLYGYGLNPDLNNRRGPAICAWIAGRFDAAAIRARRRENYQRLAERLSDVRELRIPLPRLPDGVCPWTFCVDALGVRDLDRRLRRRGVPAFTFGEALHQVLPSGAFPHAEYLSANLIQLPIHQDIALEQIERMATAVREAVRT